MSTASCRRTGARRSSVARRASGRRGAGRGLARAGRRDPRALRRGRQRAGAGALRSRPRSRARRRAVAAWRPRRGRRVPARRRRRLVRRAAPRRRRRPAAHRHRARRSTRTGSTSSRCAIRSKCRARGRASVAVAVAAASAMRCASPNLGADRTEAGRRPAAAGPGGRPPRFFMYEGTTGERFTIYCRRAMAPQSALRYRAAGVVGSFFWVDDDVAYRGERAGRPGAAAEGRRGGLPADRNAPADRFAHRCAPRGTHALTPTTRRARAEPSLWRNSRRSPEGRVRDGAPRR